MLPDDGVLPASTLFPPELIRTIRDAAEPNAKAILTMARHFRRDLSPVLAGALSPRMAACLGYRSLKGSDRC
ncbi:hypothetical protein [Sphingomonas sp. 37zxx]|uniref:hypothetical protein n=1 Tax=Sphingomonas sp. 37zxx TaxID=1550073 RepID=UPI00053BE5F6|nr:hypothetical protein [Sphingomonas sp. 37zxx]